MDLHIAADARGRTNLEWLDSRHSFSFGGYHDPARMGWGALRVLNDDRVAPGAGFGTHAHRDMEIISYVTSGRMAHRDSTGEQGLVEAGQFQLMSAGSGISHSEFNASSTEELHFLQIWILPARAGGMPGYRQRAFPRERGLQAIATFDGRADTLPLRQDATLSRLVLAPGESITLPAQGRRGYLHVVDGRLRAGLLVMGAGDGLGTLAHTGLDLAADTAVEALVFELPA